MKTKTILTLILVTIIVIFSLQNSEITDVNFLFWKISVSRILVILGSFSFGVILGLLLSIKRNHTTSKNNESNLE